MNPEEIESFAVLPLSKKTQKGLREAKFTVPTKVQRQSLVFSLQGLDVVAAAKTGSGKTLAFIVPVSRFICAASNSYTFPNLDELWVYDIADTF